MSCCTFSDKKMIFCNVTGLPYFLHFQGNYVLFYFSNHPLIFGEASRNLPILIQIISEALYHEVVDNNEEVKEKMLRIARTALVSLDLKRVS